MLLKSNSKIMASVLLGVLSMALLNGCGKKDKDISNPEESKVAPQFNSVVTFGDSLSDTGNAFYLTSQFAGDLSPFPSVLKNAVPITPADGNGGYYAGRFSNGPNWSDQFLKALVIDQKDSETCFLRGSDASCNYAIGGSTTTSNPSIRLQNTLLKDDPISEFNQLINDFDSQGALQKIEALNLKIPEKFGIDEMVSNYFSNVDRPNDEVDHTLFVVWGGANDLMGSGTPGPTSDHVVGMVKNILDHNSDDTNKRYILVPNLPDLGATPYGTSQGDHGVGLTDKTNEYNAELKTKLDSQITNNPAYKDRAVILFVDVNGTFNAIKQNPATYGFTNIADQCYSGSYMPGTGGTVCSDEAHYAFWDNIHPTNKAHCYIAKAALQSLADNGLLSDANFAKNFSCN